MLAGMRSRFLLSLLFTLFGVVSLSVQAQVNGVPASVSSIGFGGNFVNGVRPSVTSLGPNGYSNNWTVFGNCCNNFFLPTNLNPTPSSAHRHRRHDRDKDQADSAVVGVLEPAYVPYPIPYAADSDDDSPDANSLADGQGNARPPEKRAANRSGALKGDDSASLNADETALPEPPEPIAVQPSTVLVFKDGHKSDVINYAIVGDTLFDFADGRSRKILLADLDLPATRKINDDRGVDFQIPVNTARQ
jgi:hypothetical protein